MNKANTKKLLQKYPKIFRQHKLPMTQTCMCWLFECGDGWFTIIDTLCAIIVNYHYNDKLNNLNPKKLCPQIEAVQVKEKYGGLRFYVNHEPDTINGVITMAERMSFIICEICGSTDNVTQTKGWIVTLCETCMKDYKERRK